MRSTPAVFSALILPSYVDFAHGNPHSTTISSTAAVEAQADKISPITRLPWERRKNGQAETCAYVLGNKGEHNMFKQC